MNARLRTLTAWTALALVSATVAVGCSNGFMDVSKPFYNATTPTTLPIMDRLDVIEAGDENQPVVTQVQPSDLIPPSGEYVIGPSDLLSVNVFQLNLPGQENVQYRRVDETGKVRLQVIGPVDASGKTPTQLEADIAGVLDRKGILRDAEVNVVVQESRQNTFSILGEGRGIGGLAVGTYVIPKPEFRLTDALALARGAPGRTKKILIFRRARLSPEVSQGVRDPDPGEDQPPISPDAGTILENVLDPDADPGTSPDESDPMADDRPAPPPGVEAGIEDQPGTRYVFVGGQYVRVTVPEGGGLNADGTLTDADAEREALLGGLVTQRIIEVPYQELSDGKLKYDVIIRPGDIIKVPDESAGFVYLMGEINRPGAYQIPGEKDLTLKQIVASAGGFGGLAVPSKVDLVRRIGDNQEAILRIDAAAIFRGEEPDFFLKPNDLINVGTSWWATPLAVTRNGFRVSYGFGFLLDRNFGNDVF